MNWLEEIRATRFTLEEVGLLALIRLQFKNRLAVHKREANEVLTNNWRTLVDTLHKKGVLGVSWTEWYIILSVKCPGDKRRAAKRRWAQKAKNSKTRKTKNEE